MKKSHKVLPHHSAIGNYLSALDDALDDDAVLGGNHGKDLSGLALVVTGVYIHGIAFLDIKFLHDLILLKDLGCQ